VVKHTLFIVSNYKTVVGMYFYLFINEACPVTGR